MFLKFDMKKLARSGKSELIVSDGLLFNSNNEYLNLRKELLIKFNLHSILNLSTGIKTSVLFFDNSNNYI